LTVVPTQLACLSALFSLLADRHLFLVDAILFLKRRKIRENDWWIHDAREV